MSAAAGNPIDPLRRSLYAKSSLGKKALGLDEDTFRLLLETRYGKRSRTELGNGQLIDLIEHFKAQGFKPEKKTPARAERQQLADGKTQRKARALWLSLYHLGVVKEPSERALAAFVKRQAKVDDLRFLTPSESFRVIEALKAMATREADVCWDPYASTNGPLDRPRARVMEAQWAILFHLGIVHVRSWEALGLWVERFIGSPCRVSYVNIDAVAGDRVIETLGAKIRKAKAVQS